MTANPFVVDTGSSLAEAARAMRLHRTGLLGVVDREGRLVGVLSASDVVWLQARESRTDAAAGDAVERACTPDPITVPPDATLVAIFETLHRHRIHHVFVVDRDRRLLGLISCFDLLWPRAMPGVKERATGPFAGDGPGRRVPSDP